MPHRDFPGGRVITLTHLAEGYERLQAQLRDLAQTHPGAGVVRNDVGNLAVLDADGTYIGWIDTLTGEVEIL
jgi:hypothetical protein